MAERISIVDVGPRDGLQNESKSLTVPQKLKLITGLKDAGLKRIEVGAFVSPVWVPQMADTAKVVRGLKRKAPLSRAYSVLVPNVKGMEQAISSGIKEVAIFGACSESFSKKNINCSIAESFKRFEDVITLARSHRIPVRGYLSTAFACPYDGPTPPSRVARLTEKMFKLGVFEVSIGDTIGVATPKQVEKTIQALKASSDLKKIAMHFHNTRGTALANVLKSLDRGIRIFDSSVAGLGGCPYAQGATGNLATEDLVYLLQGMGFQTGVSLDKLIGLRFWLEKTMGKSLPALVKESKIYFK